MSAQLIYSINQGLAFAGMLADTHDHDIVSRSIETVAGADFGIVVGRGTNADKQVVIGGALTVFLGLTVRSLERENVNNGTVKYSEKETAGIMRRGYIYAVCPAGCVPGDVVKYTTATGIVDAGAAGAGEALVPGATWESTAVAGALAIVRIVS